MLLTEMVSALRIELQDTNVSVFTDDELIRALEKCVSLMSRLLPKRDVVETTVVREITNETLTIADDTGTLAYKPIKVGSLVITGKTLDTDYRVNYLTGVVTEIGSNLPNNDYTASYTLDSLMLDISSLLSNYIRIERMEYPAGNSPASLPTFDIVGDFVILRGSNLSLTEKEHLRLTYLGRWTPPSLDSNGDYPSHLNDAVIIGSVGQALIFKAEHYVQQAASALSTLTAPTDYTFSKPSEPSLPSAPTAPTAPSLSFIDVEYALDKMATGTPETGAIVDALIFLTTGAAFLNAATRGDDVAEGYGRYASTKLDAATAYANRALAGLRALEAELTQYASEVASYGSDVNQYANEVSGTVGKYRGATEAEIAGINNFSAQVSKYATQVSEQEMKVRNFLNIAGRYLASGQAKINEFLISLGLKPELPMQKASSEQRS